MDHHLDSWNSSKDPRRVFLQCYRAMTSNMLSAIDEGYFEDPEWVSRLLHHFADYYFDALICHECHRATPLVWANVYEVTHRNELHPLQLLLTGVNAHINYDLAFALYDLLHREWDGASEGLRSKRLRDHERVNEVIANTIDQVQDEVIEPGHPLMALIDILCGRLDEYLLSRLIRSWRSEVWSNALRLIECNSDEERESFRMQLENKVIRITAKVVLK